MQSIRRYALYLAPTGPWAEAAADWLGWDLATGRARAQPDLPALPRPLSALTAEARKYGFHATIKPPFRLAEGQDVQALTAAVAMLCARLAPVETDGLAPSDLDGFLALTPLGETAALDALAADVVRSLDAFRAPSSDAELARRRAAGLNPAQEENLARWGYPYVMGEFRCHLTLTGRLAPDEAATVQAAARRHLGPMPAPWRIDSLVLAGEQADGGFRLLHRYAFTG